METSRRVYIYENGKSELGELMLKDLFLSVAVCYADIWKEPPWCEDFWKPEEVAQDIEEQLSRPGAIGVFGLDWNDSLETVVKRYHGRMFNTPEVYPGAIQKVFGFSWGYTVTEGEMCDISGRGPNDWQALGLGRRQMFYIDELGVAKDFRRHGYGNVMTNLMLITAKLSGNELILLRTDVDAEAAQGLYAKLGFRKTGLRDKTHSDREYLMYNGASPYWRLG